MTTATSPGTLTPYTAGSHGDHFIDFMTLSETPELRQHLQGTVHRLRSERPSVEAAGAKPDHILLAVDHLEGQVRAHLDHDHVDGVGADVDCGDAHSPPVSSPVSGVRLADVKTCKCYP